MDASDLKNHRHTIENDRRKERSATRKAAGSVGWGMCKGCKVKACKTTRSTSQLKLAAARVVKLAIAAESAAHAVQQLRWSGDSSGRALTGAMTIATTAAISATSEAIALQGMVLGLCLDCVFDAHNTARGMDSANVFCGASSCARTRGECERTERAHGLRCCPECTHESARPPSCPFDATHLVEPARSVPGWSCSDCGAVFQVSNDPAKGAE